VTDSIHFKIQSGTGIIHLNRPKVLNALDLEMATLFLDKLKEWKINKTIKRVLLVGEGKALCAGGDIKSLFFSSDISKLKQVFFKKEYTLNYAISQFPKPYMSIWDGIVMGGGIGLSIHGNIRLASEKTKFAMPETAIGFFPDVGGSYFLSRLKKGIGFFLGLTGHVLNSMEVVSLGLATHFLKSNNINKAQEKYINRGELPVSATNSITISEILMQQDFIQNIFHDNIRSIMKKLDQSSHPFAKKTYKNLLTRCPMSLAVTTELLQRAKNLTLKECLEMEYQLSQHIVYRDDFNIGIKAALVSKSYNPKWSPSTIRDIDFKEIKKLFKPHIEPLNLK